MAEITSQDERDATLLDHTDANADVEVGAQPTGWQDWSIGGPNIQINTNTPMTLDRIMYLRPRAPGFQPAKRVYCVWIKDQQDLPPLTSNMRVSIGGTVDGKGQDRVLDSVFRLQAGVYTGMGKVN